MPGAWQARKGPQQTRVRDHAQPLRMQRPRMAPALRPTDVLQAVAWRQPCRFALPADDEKSRGELRIEFGALGDAARYDGRYGRGKREEEEELDQRVAAVRHEGVGGSEERDPVRDCVADDSWRHKKGRAMAALRIT